MLLLHQSHWHIRIFILHQSYDNIGISRSKYSVGVLFSFHWCHGVKNDINPKLWAHFVIVMVGSLSECPIVLVKDMLGLERVAGNFFVSFFKLKHWFFYGSFTHNASDKKLTSHQVLWQQYLKSKQNILNHYTAWALGNFDFISVGGTAVSVVSFASVVWSCIVLSLQWGESALCNKTK